MTSEGLAQWKASAEDAFRMLIYFSVIYLIGYFAIIYPLSFLLSNIPTLQSLIPILYAVIIVYGVFLAIAKMLNDVIGNPNKQQEKLGVKTLKIKP